ncbi:MAG: ABC transporter ATP-binding protein [Anaerolineales bacterium]
MSQTLATGHRRIDHLQMRGIVKQFPGVLAADRIDFDVRAEEVHALLGENGAGKSTLMKMLYGLYKPDEGDILLNDQAVEIASPQDAIQQGIGMIHQHFMLVPSFTVAENVALGMRSGRGPLLDLETVARDIVKLSDQYGLKVDPHIPIWQLSVGEQQRVEILRALYRGAALLVLDEPTAVLTPQEVDELFVILRQLAADGHALIFISHKLHEVLAISHRVTVLRDGRKVDTIPTSEATKPKLAEMMVGRPVVLAYDVAPRQPGEPRLQLDNVSALRNRGDRGLNGVSLTVRSGEILGVAGVSGNGQHELAEVIAGLRAVTEGRINMLGQDITGKAPAELNELGLSHIPEERMEDGVIREFSVAENRVLQDHGRHPFARWIFMLFRVIAGATKQSIKDFEIKTPSHETLIKNLSGGNIQKLVLARELSREPAVLIAAQPTRGVDIGATEYIHKRLLAEREKGTAILLISEDLDEIRALSDRVIVLYEGRIVGEVARADVDVNELGLMMAGSRLEDIRTPDLSPA